MTHEPQLETSDKSSLSLPYANTSISKNLSFGSNTHIDSDSVDVIETFEQAEDTFTGVETLENALQSIPAIDREPNPHLAPHIGMEFISMKDVELYYKAFAKQEDFAIRIRSSKPNSCIYVCSNEGQNVIKSNVSEESSNHMTKKKRRCSTSRTGCNASLVVSKAKKEDKWIIRTFSNSHNHAMVSPQSVSLLRCHKKMSAAAKNLMEKFNEEGLPSGKVSTMFNGLNLSFSSRDCWNHLRNVRRRDLEVGDAQAVFNFCKKKQAENSNFFYAIQCDEDDRMVNFFWVDARSRLAYQNFGDVVTFDTTYKTNKYSMPFSPFTGLNHRCQSILFGCALLQDETENTFVWLFETWLEAMNGKSPVSIVTTYPEGTSDDDVDRS